MQMMVGCSYSEVSTNLSGSQFLSLEFSVPYIWVLLHSTLEKSIVKSFPWDMFTKFQNIFNNRVSFLVSEALTFFSFYKTFKYLFLIHALIASSWNIPLQAKSKASVPVFPKHICIIFDECMSQPEFVF